MKQIKIGQYSNYTAINIDWKLYFENASTLNLNARSFAMNKRVLDVRA